MHRFCVAVAAATLSGILVAGCSGVGPKPDYDPHLTAADFVATIDNPYLPYPHGAWWRYEADGGATVIEVRVLNETKQIMGVTATVVRDSEYEDGELKEDTWDWFAQDKKGNVWYLGEDTGEYEDGKLVSTHGAWQWGVDGALPGVIMWAHPVANKTAYFQEFFWGEAVDEAEVVALGHTIVTPAGTFKDTVTTHEWTRLERGSDEQANYARGVGLLGKWDEKGYPKGDAEILVAYHVPASTAAE